MDYTQSSAWKYRIVEVTLTKGADGKDTAVPVGDYIGLPEGRFAVTYNYADTGISIDDTKNTGSAAITNTYQPLTSIQILKIKAGTSEKNPEKLAGAEFKLEKLTAGGTITVQTVATGKENEELGVAKFENLEDGTYQITETKAPDGYNLLKSPIKVEINRSDNSIKVDGRTDVFDKISDNTIEIKVANQAKFQLPATGSWSRLILGFTGAIIAGTAVIMYLLLQKRRKEGKTS